MLMTRIRRAVLPVLALSLLAPMAHAATDLKTIMQNPDWIGPPVEAAWWQLDGSGYQYQAKRDGSAVRDLFSMSIDGSVEAVDAGRLATSDGRNPVVHREARLAASVVNGALMLRDLESGESRAVLSGASAVRSVGFTPDGRSLQFQAEQGWWRYDIGTGQTVALTDLRFERPPHEADADPLAEEQLRLFATLERERQWEQDAYEQRLRRAGEARLGSAPWYLGEGKQLVDSALSPNGRWLLAVVRDAGAQPGKRDKMPHYVTRSGYVDVEDVRRLVGRETPKPHALWLLDLAERSVHKLDLDSLSGRDEDPLAALKKAQDIKPHDADKLRPVSINQVVWHEDGEDALIQVRAIDNKDRWTLRLSAEDQSLREIHRLSDEAWINWLFNDLGWVPGTDTAWLLSEETGYSHLYTIDVEGEQTALTRGDFEIAAVSFLADGRSAVLMSNRAHPTEYDLYEVIIGSPTLDRLTELRGVEDFVLHPEGDRILLRYSSAYRPAQAAVLELTTRELVARTDTLTHAYKAIDWQVPEYVAVPSRHGAEQPIWSKFYPAQGDHSGPRPVVLFVHGAGYTQNTHHKFPYYFREQMFHNLLTEQGYHVLDMDYRASRGYGRDWRTAIYRQMGTPELEDLIDGVRWLVEEHNADPERVGVYGGSYGGFMTFMAMFKAPEVFAAGASLRPVTDWRHYNNGYTSNILNSPKVDPEAHRISSPIEFVEGLQGDLLISHGMLDDNVFYKDSVRLAQRLIELEKENWELASYPLEPHGYVHPEAWLDQYRRIYKLFENSIGD